MKSMAHAGREGQRIEQAEPHAGDAGNLRVGPPFSGPSDPAALGFAPVAMPAMWDPIAGLCEATTVWMPVEHVREQERCAAAWARRAAPRIVVEPEPELEPAANAQPLIHEHVGTWTDTAAPALASPKKARPQPKPKRRTWVPKVRAAARRFAPRLYLEIEGHREDGIGRTAVRRFAAAVLKVVDRAHDVADAALERLVGAGKVVRQEVGRVVRFVASLFVAGAAERALPAARHENARPHRMDASGASGPEDAGIGPRSVPSSPPLRASRRTGRRRSPAPVSFAASFWPQVERANTRASGCREWLARRDRDGYGRVGQSGKAHRIAFEIHYGVRLPSELHVLHDCDNPACCNPRHMTIGSHADNMRDRQAKGRY